MNINNESGFTLIELMVTIAVFAILVSIAAPSFSEILAKQKLNSTTSELINTINTARSQAVTLRKDITLTLKSDSKSTDTEFFWKPETGTELKQPTSVQKITFTAFGTLKQDDAGADFQSMDFIICHTKANKSKILNLNRMGNLTMGADKSC